MADKLLKSIKFPTLPDRYVIGDTTLTEEGAAAEAKAVGEALATKADTKGTYEDLIVGGAEQLMADGYETDSEPYLFRTTGGSADVGNREYLDKIVGGTVAWNQLFSTMSTDTKDGITTSYDSTTHLISIRNDSRTANYSSGSSRANVFSINNMLQNHVYLIAPSKMIKGVVFAQGLNCYAVKNIDYSLYIRITSEYDFVSAHPIGDVTSFYLNIIDLTALFNPTIADYIYSLEQANAGAGVAFFRKLFPKPYYAYNAGELMSVQASSHDMVGFNAWDEEREAGGIGTGDGQNTSTAGYYRTKNYIPIIANATYYVKSPISLNVFFYDADKAYIRWANVQNDTVTLPENARFMRFRNATANEWNTYNNDICINLSDPTRNGEYEPYQKHTYPLDSSLTLRGTPKLVDGKLAFDGDVYPPSGEVQRRYGLRAYQSGDESLADAITDGTNTVYELATPTTETAEGYEHYQICDPSGTEQFVTTGIVPVGHETRYPHDLKKKIETAPDSPSADGTYLMKRSGGKNTYMALPSTPSANGAYVLTVTVSGGSASYSWTAKE